jgi:hypothetical protein
MGAAVRSCEGGGGGGGGGGEGSLALPPRAECYLQDRFVFPRFLGVS